MDFVGFQGGILTWADFDSGQGDCDGLIALDMEFVELHGTEKAMSW